MEDSGNVIATVVVKVPSVCLLLLLVLDANPDQFYNFTVSTRNNLLLLTNQHFLHQA